MVATPNFTDKHFLESHIQSILAFYENRAVDANGGFFQTFRDNGEIVDPGLKHLVSSTRFIFNYANAYHRYGKSQHLDWAGHGLSFLEKYHKQPAGHYCWELRDKEISDGRAMAYGHAFVILAASSAVRAGITDADAIIDSTWDFMEQMFWEAEHSAYADERDSTLAVLDPYRGQNANMHMCEALIAAWEATRNQQYLDRAEILAYRFAVELSTQAEGLIWEHYDSNWLPDLDYNRDKPGDLFKPWGFQPGHQVEWSKLLMLLNQHAPADWYIQRAGELFDQALTKGWDTEFGGLVYGFAPDGSFCDTDKYFWVHAEAFAAAWRLYQHSGNAKYLEDYLKLWQWSWTHLIDHDYGAWFRIRSRSGAAIADLKSPPGKTDYHTLGACWDVLDS